MACAFCCLVTCRLLAQDSRPTFRTRTELVRMDVSVTGKDGRPIADLRPDEIEITENGRRRPVVLFRHINDARDGEREVNARAVDQLSSNDLAPSGHLYVLVFDQLHIATGHEQRARLAAERFISRGLAPGDAVAIYGLPGPGPLLNFTTDLIRARATLAAVHGQAHRPPGAMSVFEAYRMARGGGQAGHGALFSPSLDLVANAGPGAGSDTFGAFDDVLRGQASQMVAQAENESQIFLSRLAGLLRNVRWINGRKAFVLFSEGFFMDNLAPRLEQVASAAAQSNSLIYSIDLNTSLAASDRSGSVMSVVETSERRDPLAALSLETNGRLITNAGNLDAALAGIAAETGDYYLVAFEPAASDAPHDYHRVKVQTTRRGLVVRARTGYATSPEPTAFEDRQAIDVALTVPRTSNALPIEYTTYERSGPAADKPRIIASVTAYLPERGNGSAGEQDRSDIVFVVRDAVTGQAVASGSDHLAAVGTGTPAGGLGPVPYCVQFEVPPGEYWMRMLVREPGGVIGTADRLFHVWPLTGQGLTTSDLIVARLEGARFDPPARATVHRDDEVLAYLEIYGAVKTLDPHIEILRAGSPDVLATAEPLVKAGSHGENIVRARLPVSGLADGLYAARVRIVAPNQAPRTIMRNFRVVAADAKGHTQQE